MGEWKLSRRQFLGLAAVGAGATAASQLPPFLTGGGNSSTVDSVAMAEASIQEADLSPDVQIDVPRGTFLTSQAGWILSLKGITQDTLEKLNGPKKYWSVPEMGGVLLAPASAFGGKEGADQGAIEILRGKVIFRIDSRIDKKTGYGFSNEELRLFQATLPYAAKRCKEFFGKPRYEGLMTISKPGPERRNAIMSSSAEAATFGGVIIGSENTPGAQEILVLTGFEEYVKQNPAIDIERAFNIYATQINELLPHEIGHAYLQKFKLGDHLDNHNIVRVAGISANIIDLIGRSPQEISKTIGEKGGMHTDLIGPEMLLWKMFKVKGVEFFARLISSLSKQYGTQLGEFSEGRVSVAANALFKEVSFGFTYEDLLVGIDQKPENGKVQFQPLEGYKYPTEKVAGDIQNPDGKVSWWIEVMVLAPPTIMPPGWSRQYGDIFPDSNGYYSVYKFAGNGKLKDGPPGGNSAAVASWMKGGSLTGGETLFPIGMPGVETIRAVKKK